MPQGSAPLQAALPDGVASAAASRGQRGVAAGVAAGLVAVGLTAAPFASLPLPPMPGAMAGFCAAMLVINALLAMLLFSKGAIEHRGDATRLGMAYLFVAAILLPLAATFPDVLVHGSLAGEAVSSVYIWLGWHTGFALCIARYAWLAAQKEPRPASARRAVAAVAVAVATLTLAAIFVLPGLPAMLGSHDAGLDPEAALFASAAGKAIPLAIVLLLATALVLVCRLRGRTLEQIWLAVGMVAALFDMGLSILGGGRYSLGWYFAIGGSLLTSLTVMMTLLYEVMILQSRAVAVNAVLLGLAHQDGLTGLCNRRRLDERLSIEWRRSGREQEPLSLLMIDVDFFKNYNDHYGHQAGDDCLRRVAALLSSSLRRPADMAARYGGEEFVLLLPGTDATAAVAIAQRVQAGMQALAIPHAASPLGCVTLSVGLATTVAAPNSPLDILLAEADRGVYRAKHTGRNRVCWSDDRVLPDGQALLARLMPERADPVAPP